MFDLAGVAIAIIVIKPYKKEKNMFDPFSLAGMAATIVAIKAYFAAHGVAIATVVIVAGAKAAIRRECVKAAALEAGASEAVADMLKDFFGQR